MKTKELQGTVNELDVSSKPIIVSLIIYSTYQSWPRGGRVVRWFWVNFQCRGVLLIWIRVGRGPTALAVGAGGGCLDIFTLVYHFSFLSPSLWETARYRLKYCFKGPLSPKTTNQPKLAYRPTLTGRAICNIKTIKRKYEFENLHVFILFPLFGVG